MPTKTELLCKVGPGTAMNKLGKQFWLPIFRSEAVEAGGKPERIELLGEKYILWRAEDNRLGFFDEACPHRLASLALGRNEDCALTCIYHGWKFGVDGKVIDLPSEPEHLRKKRAEMVKLKHFAVREVNGIVWVFLGDQDNIPSFPEFEFNLLKPEQVLGLRAEVNGNWLPTLEAGIDPAHLNFLHNGHTEKIDKDDKMADWALIEKHTPEYKFKTTEYGFTEAAIRRPDDGTVYIRKRHVILPFLAFVPFQKGMTHLAIASIPVNDKRCIHWIINYTEADNIVEEIARQTKLSEDAPMINLNNYAEGMGTEETLWDQDREFMKEHWSGIRGPLPWEDIVVAESMGEVDHSKEFLGDTDFVIMKTRRAILKMLEQVENGEDLSIIGSRFADLSKLRSIALRLPGEVDWMSIDGKNPPQEADG